MASHEFRTPLAAINAAADVILRYYDRLNQDDIYQRLEKIKREVKDMTIMLEDILIIGKADSQKLEYNPVEINLVAEVKKITADYQLAESGDREIKVHYATENIPLIADPKWIKHITINLLSNALKYSEKEIEIVIKEENEQVVLMVKDQGIGISEKDQKKLFDPFHRGENVGNISGTGLGLSVLEKAVALHGAKIEVESKPNEGSTFKVTFQKQ